MRQPAKKAGCLFLSIFLLSQIQGGKPASRAELDLLMGEWFTKKYVFQAIDNKICQVGDVRRECRKRKEFPHLPARDLPFRESASGGQMWATPV